MNSPNPYCCFFTWLQFITACKHLHAREAWCAAVHGVTKSQTWLGNWTTTSIFRVGCLFCIQSRAQCRSEKYLMSLCYELTFLLHCIISFSFTQGVCVCFVFSPIVSRLLMEKEPMKKPFIFIFNFYFLLLEDNYFTILWWSLKKQKHHFADKDPHSRSYSFPVGMYGCDSWTIKKAEHWRIDASNCGAGEDSWESLGLQGDQISQS